MSEDIRWVQRFSNFNKALLQLQNATALSQERELSILEKQGVIQSFEYTHELAWKSIKDFLEYRGQTQQIYGSKDATRVAFQTGLISHGDDWMEMIKSRNLTSHTYDESRVEEIVDFIFGNYIFRFEELCERFLEILAQEES